MAANKEPSTVVPLLSRALHRIRSTPPRIIASPATQPRRAAVAIIIRVSPPPNYVFPKPPAEPSSPANTPAPSLSEFFQLDWVNAPGARPEILFLRRDKPEVGTDGGRMSGTGPNTREAHVAFPGGKSDEGDEGGLYTAMRQTWEEIGLDLAESSYTPIGQLDDREITTSLGKRLLMILSPFVFLQLTPRTTSVDPSPGTTLHWVPLTALLPRPVGDGPRWSSVSVDASSRLAPRHSTVLRLLVRLLVGSMKFPAILIPSSPMSFTSDTPDEKTMDVKRAQLETAGSVPPSMKRQRSRYAPDETLKLWGLSLGMTLDLLMNMAPPEARRGGAGAMLLPPDAEAELLRVPVLAPSLASVFPRFGYPDVNFWIWVFGKRYRAVIRGWEASMRAGGTNDRRINWTGSALTTFYAAVRKALVVVIVVRAIFVLLGILLSSWLLFWR
ncbi:hypothetical protein L226DRAFT_548867 [Lentinus tigrinus ALCF2SS1-7]|uniref:uncharacterized protein n=1 Tax=Lentinus tigrinus ALCF2SS1-7 TaxID=1328758 RepID=UPI001165E556|nr:hypothetical protein L226DRAFT_548867 [Lentinus tigrinus ALCF2SS1-7]